MELIKAKEGCYITQATLKEGEERVFGKEVCAIVPSQWVEWTSEQKTEYDNSISSLSLLEDGEEVTTEE